MNARILWRIVWKEYRVFRSFWLSLLLFVACAELLVAKVPFGYFHSAMYVFGLAVGAAAFYAVGCCGAIFSTEHEEGTYDFLRTLPLTARQVYWGKVLLALLSIAALLAALWLVATWGVAYARLQKPQGWASITWGLWGVGILEAIAWGVLFSLLVARPLQAILLSVAMVSLLDHFLVSFFSDGQKMAFEADAYLPVIPYRLALAAVVFLVDIWLGQRWYTRRIAAHQAAAPTGTLSRWRRVKAKPTDETETPLNGPYRVLMLARLAWQSARHNAGLLKTFAAIVLALSLAGAFLPAGSVGMAARANRGIDVVLLSGALLLVVVLAPACVFLGDQERHLYRFFTERGIRARDVWLSRHLVWFPFTVALAGTALIVAGWREWWSLFSQLPPLTGGTPDMVGSGMPNANALSLAGVLLWAIFCFCMLVLTFYAVGQLCSMLVRKGILAGVLSVVLCATLGSWAMLISMLDISWVWALLPLPLAMLLFTRLSTQDWLLERRGWRFRLRVALVLLLPVASVLFAVRCYRIYQIPAVPPTFDISAFRPAPPTAADERAAQLYRLASSEFAGLPSNNRDPDAPALSAAEIAELEAREKREAVERNTRSGAIQDALEASRLPLTGFVYPDVGERYYYAEQVGTVMVIAAEQKQMEGKLDEAWEYYRAALCFARYMWFSATPDYWNIGGRFIEDQVYSALPVWAAEPNQTPERIEHVLRELTELQRTFPPLLKVAEWRFWLIRQRLNSAPFAPIDHFLWLEWTGERQRADRALDYLAHRQWSTFRAIQQEVERGQPVKQPLAELADQRFSPERSWLQTTVLLAHDWNLLEYHAYSPATEWLAAETRRRAVRIILAIEAYRARQGKLPTQLEELVGDYLDAVPLDPYTGRPFEYRPQGISAPLTIRLRQVYSSTAWTLPAMQPFVWSTGGRVRDAAEGPGQVSMYSEAQHAWVQLDAQSSERWPFGLAFPISAVKQEADATQ